MSDMQPPVPAYGAYDSDVPAAGLGDDGTVFREQAPQGARGLGIASVVLAGMVTLTQAGSFLSSFDAAARLSDPAVPVVWTTYDTIDASNSVLWLVALVVTGTFLARSRTFAEGYAPEVAHARARGWAWWGWLVPIVAYWFPYQVVRDVARGHRLALDDMVRWWWAAWLAATWIGSRGTFSSLRLTSVDPGALPVYEGLETVALLFAFVVWERIVTRITAVQTAAIVQA